MNEESTFRSILIVGLAVVLPLGLYHRIRAATGERLDRRREGLFMLLTLRPLGFAAIAATIAYAVDPAWMAWSSVPLPAAARWAGVAVGVLAASLLAWTLRSLGSNLTDTVVTRKKHALVTAGPYRFVRHPFYGCVALAVLANSLAAANAFIFAAGGLALMLLAVRTRTEEENLLARFGDAYKQYQRETGRFFPRVRDGKPAPP